MGVDFNDCSDMFLNTVHLMMENKIMSEKMRYDSEHDLLTGLYNRRIYYASISRYIFHGCKSSERNE